MKKKCISATTLSFVVFWLGLLVFGEQHIKNLSEIPLALQAEGGAHGLPPIVQEMATMAKAHKLATYNLSKALADNLHVYQRAVEHLYPARISERAHGLFVAHGETPPIHCALREPGAHVSLYECSR